MRKSRSVLPSPFRINLSSPPHFKRSKGFKPSFGHVIGTITTPKLTTATAEPICPSESDEDHRKYSLPPLQIPILDFTPRGSPWWKSHNESKRENPFDKVDCSAEGIFKVTVPIFHPDFPHNHRRWFEIPNCVFEFWMRSPKTRHRFKTKCLKEFGDLVYPAMKQGKRNIPWIVGLIYLDVDLSTAIAVLLFEHESLH